MVVFPIYIIDEVGDMPFNIYIYIYIYVHIIPEVSSCQLELGDAPTHLLLEYHYFQLTWTTSCTKLNKVIASDVILERNGMKCKISTTSLILLSRAYTADDASVCSLRVKSVLSQQSTTFDTSCVYIPDISLYQIYIVISINE